MDISSPSLPLEVADLPTIDAADDAPRGIDWLLSTVGPRTLLLLDPSGRHAPQGFYLDEETRSTAPKWVQSHNCERVGMNVYFHLNRTAPGFRKKAADSDITAIEIVGQADIDAKAGRSIEDCWAVIRALPLPPTFTIMTGGGFQIGYQLDEALPPSEKAWAVAVAKELQRLTGGDAVSDVSRIFRLPFTTNWPTEAKQRGGRSPTPSGLVIGGRR